MTVVVIGYNDAANLPTAVRSVTRQTLRDIEVVVVDDASTDLTPAVAAGLAAADPRVRLVRLDTNSGGCSRPRNVGVAEARGRYVMFLDSDDELDRHACEVLWRAAEDSGADLAAGRAVRHYRTRRRTAGWYDHLYAEPLVLDGILDRPEQLFDTICTNKLYRREFIVDNGLQFPEGLHYEDLLFTTEAYCTARRIAIVPDRIYVWNVVEDSDRVSISNQRLSLRNWHDRMTIHRRIDDYLAGHHVGRQLRVAKDAKFLNHDFKLFLRDLLRYPPEERPALFDLVRDYLPGLEPPAYERAHLASRIGAFLVRRGDLARTERAAELYLTGQVRSDVVRIADRAYWTAAYVDDEEARRALDVTAQGWAGKPFAEVPFGNVLESAAVRGTTLELTGEVGDVLGRLAGLRDRLRLAVVAVGLTGAERFRAPVGAVDWRDGGLRYAASVDLAALARALGPVDRVLRLRLRISAGDEVNTAAIGLPGRDLDAGGADVPTRYGPVLGRRIEPRALNDTLALVLTEAHPALARGAAMLRGARSAKPVAAARRLARLRDPVVARRTAHSLAYKGFRRLPVRRGTAVFESHMGRQYGDSPKYVHQALVRSGAPWTVNWSYATSRDGFPPDARLVRRGGLRWLHALARAEVWVDNQGFPRTVTKRPETTYVQTWHGTPLKTMGFDEPKYRTSPAARRTLARMTARWDYFVVPCDYTARKLVPAFGFTGEVLRVGYPRNDPLVTGDETVRRDVRRELGIPDGVRVVLYAPTFRDPARRRGEPFELALDLDGMAALGDDHLLLVRTHYLDSWQVPARHAGRVRDVSAHHDVTELLVAADVLVTDYSSLMFDWATTGRPVVFYAYDYDSYANDERGTYFDLAAEAPGPVVATTAEVVAWLRDPDRHRTEFLRRYAAFRATYCEYETGKAAETVVERVFLRGGR